MPARPGGLDGCNGPAVVAVIFQFTGTFIPSSFEHFARHRAERLSLVFELQETKPNGMDMRVEGLVDLVDCFEVACLLGPADCLIDNVERLVDPMTSSPEGKMQ